MPLGILLPLVIFGIAGIAILLHLLGLSRRAWLDGETAAEAAWLREFPEQQPTRVTLCKNRSAALIDTGKGLGIVWTIGADTTARRLTGARILRTTTGLRIDLPDVTAPRIKLHLDDTEVAIWAARMEAPA